MATSGRVRPAIRRPQCASAGFTLLEVMCSIAVFGIVSAIAVTALRGWTRAHDELGTAETIESVLRDAQQRAVTEGRSACVDFDVAAQAYSVYRGACDEVGRLRLQGPLHPNASYVRIASPAFTGTAGATTGVTFNPRGTAWAGSVQVTRAGSSKVYTVHVEGLTGRVSRA